MSYCTMNTPDGTPFRIQYTTSFVSYHELPAGKVKPYPRDADALRCEVIRAVRTFFFNRAGY